MTRIDNKKDIKKKKGSNKKVKDKKVEIVNDNKTKEKELYTSKEVIIVMIFSIGIGILMCFGGISIITGKNYLAVTRNWSVDRVFQPAISEEERAKRIKGWNKAVRCAYHWAKDEEE